MYRRNELSFLDISRYNVCFSHLSRMHSRLTAACTRTLTREKDPIVASDPQCQILYLTFLSMSLYESCAPFTIDRAYVTSAMIIIRLFPRSFQLIAAKIFYATRQSQPTSFVFSFYSRVYKNFSFLKQRMLIYVSIHTCLIITTLRIFMHSMHEFAFVKNLNVRNLRNIQEI